MGEPPLCYASEPPTPMEAVQVREVHPSEVEREKIMLSALEKIKDRLVYAERNLTVGVPQPMQHPKVREALQLAREVGYRESLRFRQRHATRAPLPT